MQNTIAAQLIAYRKDKKLTQDDIAALLDVTQQTVANWENGTMPRPNALAGVLAMLGSSTAPIVTVQSAGKQHSAIQIAFLSKAQELVESGKLDDAACVNLLVSWKVLF